MGAAAANTEHRHQGGTGVCVCVGLRVGRNEPSRLPMGGTQDPQGVASCAAGAVYLLGRTKTWRQKL